MHYQAEDHLFVICAYKESPYLEACIRSLERQTVPSSVMIATSTPSPFLEAAAGRHGIRIAVREGEPDIAEDWNFGIGIAERMLVTLAHQDDIYQPHYLEQMLRVLNAADHPLIGFSDYYEIRGKKRIFWNRSVNLAVKKAGLAPLGIRAMQSRIFVRRAVLSLGCMICCPSVTYVKDHLPADLFERGLMADLDWAAWERISRMPGDFCYVPRPLMGHRIHGESTTTRVIGEKADRSAEDIRIYRRFWPEPVAEFLNRLYALSQKGNRM